MYAKMLLFVLLAFLGVFSLAAPTQTEPVDTTSVVPFVPDVMYKDPPPLGPNVLVGSVVMPDGTVVSADEPAMGTTDAEKPRATLVLTMGTSRQHIGFTVSRNIVQEFSDTLDFLCDGQTSLIPGQICKRDGRWLRNIRYNAGFNSGLIIKIESDYIPSAPGSSDSNAILTLFQDQIVRMFRAAVNCDKNRYRLWYPSGMWKEGPGFCVEMANSADWYQVALYGLPGDGPRPHLRVSTKFNGKTDEGTFDCKGTLSSIWSTVDDHRVTYTYAKAMDVPMGVAVACGDNWGEGWPDGHCDKPKGVPEMHCMGDQRDRGCELSN